MAAMPKGGSQEWEENSPGTSKHTNKIGDSIHQIQGFIFYIDGFSVG